MLKSIHFELTQTQHVILVNSIDQEMSPPVVNNMVTILRACFAKLQDVHRGTKRSQNCEK